MQKVGPTDLLAIQVYDSPEFTRTVRVSAEGTIRLPMLKALVPVDGMLPSEIEVQIAEALRHEQLLVDPYVTVNVAEYHSRPVTVIGAVRTPLTFQVIGAMRLADALARAGGLDVSNAGPEIIVTRPNGDAGAQSVRRIPWKTLLAGTDPELNLILTGGEEIRVPEVAKIIVEGSVARPGVYPVQDPVTLNTVSTAIAQAGGLIQFADHKAFILRVDDQGVTHTIPVPLWEIINRRKPDITLQARDILQVPDSPKRRITQTTINSLTGIGTTAATTSIYLAH
ncbi:MAG TPA: polysaccharide biosynthesis/export family protein [Bryobacteraceae bacterium]|nr:polysaccharide biosynthesis/export family protein [Bryobacteraceae bacterium]